MRKVWVLSAVTAGSLLLGVAGAASAREPCDDQYARGYNYRVYRPVGDYATDRYGSSYRHDRLHDELGDRHERYHEGLDRAHDRLHDRLEERYDRWRWQHPFASRRQGERVRDRLEREHERGHESLERRHERGHDRLERLHDRWHDREDD